MIIDVLNLPINYSCFKRYIAITDILQQGIVMFKIYLYCKFRAIARVAPIQESVKLGNNCLFSYHFC